MFSPKGPEWIIILVVVLLIFGARKLPELARSLGASAKEFRKGIQEGSEEAAATGEAPPKTENNS
ncbi:MAG: twin-arginine translocase TatA/TatE family subunit [Acidimicrobiia bacterium]